MNEYVSRVRHSRIFTRVAESLSTEFDGTIAVRGSLAQGGFCRHSDIDLVLVGRSVEDDERLAVLDQLEPLCASLGRRISLVAWHDATPDTLEFWLGATECRFVGGDVRVFAMHRDRWDERLRALPLETLFAMRASDPRRCWYPTARNSPLGLNLKRACGGLVDAQFVSLLRRALRLRGIVFDDCAPLIRESARIGTRLLAIRSALHAFTGVARESAWFDPIPARLPPMAWPARAATVLDRQHALIELLERRLAWKIS
jgi:predicted nucleotidyltransferase